MTGNSQLKFNPKKSSAKNVTCDNNFLNGKARASQALTKVHKI